MIHLYYVIRLKSFKYMISLSNASKILLGNIKLKQDINIPLLVPVSNQYVYIYK